MDNYFPPPTPEDFLQGQAGITPSFEVVNTCFDGMN